MSHFKVQPIKSPPFTFSTSDPCTLFFALQDPNHFSNNCKMCWKLLSIYLHFFQKILYTTCQCDTKYSSKYYLHHNNLKIQLLFYINFFKKCPSTETWWRKYEWRTMPNVFACKSTEHYVLFQVRFNSGPQEKKSLMRVQSTQGPGVSRLGSTAYISVQEHLRGRTPDI